MLQLETDIYKIIKGMWIWQFTMCNLFGQNKVDDFTEDIFFICTSNPSN